MMNDVGDFSVRFAHSVPFGEGHRMPVRSTIPTLLFLFLFAIAASAPAQEEPGARGGRSVRVTAVGKAQAGGVAAEDEALRDALRKAVEKGAGQFISSVSATQDYELVHDEIFSEVKGFVETYTVLRKYTQGDILCIEIEAVVSVDAFRAGWEKLQSLINRWGKRRFACIVTDKIDGKDDQGHATQAAIEKVFLDRGFPMVDKAQVEQVRERDVTAANLEGNLQQVAAFGKRFGAEVMLVGDANAGDADRREIAPGISAWFYQPSVEIRAIRTDNAMVIASERATEQRGSQNRSGAAKDALALAGTKVAKQIVNQVIKAMLKDTMGQGNLVQLVVDQVGGLRNVRTLERQLKAIRGINGVFQREMANNMVTFDIETTIPAQELGDRLLEFTEPKMDVTGITLNRIDAKVVK